jgi:cell division protease FtsH
MALGVTQQLPLDDRYTYSKVYLEAQLAVLMAGRIAEQMFLDQTTTGAANDFEKATEIARKMVCQYGMSKLGPLTFGERDDLVFLGRDLAMHKNFSENTAELIDEEVKAIVNAAFDKAKSILGSNKDALLKIASALLEVEVLTSDEIETLINGGKISLKKNKTAASSGETKKRPRRRTVKKDQAEDKEAPEKTGTQ